jgi:hypothetical protein
MNEKREPVTTCPVCGEGFSVRELACDSCGSQLRGNFSFPRLARLPKDLQDVVEVFLRCRGNIKEVERELGISYPTVSKKLDQINLLLLSMGSQDEGKARILRQLDAGELSVADALELLKARSSEEQERSK